MKNMAKKEKSEKKRILPENIFATTHTGLIRDSNEDSYAYCTPGKGQNVIVAVADGIGGHENGDIASRLCLRTILIEWRRKKMWSEKSIRKIEDFLGKAIAEANKEIYKLNLSFNVQQPMGTTLVLAVITSDKIAVAHAGDSRFYRYDGKTMKSLTRDHSFVEELVLKKIITREEAKDHPFSHVISRCVGTADELEPEINVFKRADGEKYFLCSDGLISHLDDEKLCEIISLSKDICETVRNLLYAALKKGGDDNITVLSVFP